MMRKWATLPLFLYLVIGFALLLLPFAAGRYVVTLGFFLWVSIALTESYSIVGGLLGYMNLGHSSFFGVSAYTFGILYSTGVPFLWAWLAGMASAIAFAAAMSMPLFRLHGAYFAVASFGLITLLELLAHNFADLTGGAAGLSLPTGDRLLPAYYLSLAVAVGSLTLVGLVGRSRLGLALMSLRDDEEVAAVFGVYAFRFKALALILSAIPPGLIGGVYAWQLTYINPSTVFGLEVALVPIVMAMLGGVGHVWGPVLGAVFITLIEEFLWTKLPYLHLATYGVILLLVGFYLPGGLVRLRWSGSMLPNIFAASKRGTA
ncbi:MAG TPA: branched-chain amino acid ABC transporter permease [Candidatus Tectomicrobia bacterium]|nr:branched-chain amino acid ABC transporter permease [Candidatus Tectomicrobia bacterium]